ncbi:hypothetical protein JNW90_10640 [Micromonospora sp. STR1s_5]|nr:hypothetical protein [Micromonospora sp. STR1s_5]
MHGTPPKYLGTEVLAGALDRAGIPVSRWPAGAQETELGALLDSLMATGWEGEALAARLGEDMTGLVSTYTVVKNRIQALPPAPAPTGPCRWKATCDRDAVVYVVNVALGSVPACRECSDLAGRLS